MFSIMLIKNDIRCIMPNDTELGLIEACARADVYKKHNSSAAFLVVNNTTGDVEYTANG